MFDTTDPRATELTKLVGDLADLFAQGPAGEPCVFVTGAVKAVHRDLARARALVGEILSDQAIATGELGEILDSLTSHFDRPDGEEIRLDGDKNDSARSDLARARSLWSEILAELTATPDSETVR